MNVGQHTRTLSAEENTYQVQNAPDDAVKFMLGLGEEGRSQWVWIRLPDGDLVLAVYPQDDAYFSTKQWRSI